MAIALAWTLVLNCYVAIYDSILLIPALLVTAAHLGTRIAKVCALALWVGGWVTQATALALNIQILTICIAGFGLLQAYWAYRTYVTTKPWNCRIGTGIEPPEIVMHDVCPAPVHVNEYVPTVVQL